MLKSLAAAGLGAVIFTASGGTLAQGVATSFPSKSITIVIPATPGGAIDLTARVIGPKLTDAWGKPVVVENKAGATGIIGTEFIAKATPDGQTLVLVASSHAINPSMFKKLPYDTMKSFEPVVLTHVLPLMLVVHPSLPVKNVQELIAYAKANPGKLSFASSGPGGAPHMSGELFKSMAGLDMIHVPYKGSTAAHSDLLAGRVSLMFDTVSAISPHVKSGALRALAVTTAKRSAAMPDVPTMAEAGMKGYETSTWGGVLAPAGTPKDVVAKLNGEINKALAAPDVRQRMLDAGIEPAGGTPQQFTTFIQSEMAKWAKVAKTAGIEPE
jgi:tripartite-type tricarboxylate transporter receptor subunit TctC